MIFLFLLALVIWLLRPSWLMPLWLVAIPVLAPILVFRSGIQNTEDLLNFIFSIWGVFQRIFIIIVLYQLLIKKKKIPGGIRSFMIPCGLLCIYFIFHNGIRHLNIYTLYQNIAGTCYYILPILVMMLDKDVRPKLNVIFGILIFIIALQIIMVPFNLKGIVVYIMRYQDKVFLQEELGLVSGTFSQSNALADFLSVAYLFICVDFFLRKGISKKTYFSMSVVMFTLLALTGSKMPIICSLMGLAMCVFCYRKKIILHIVGVLVGLVLIVVFSWEYIEKLGEEYRGVDRFVSGMTNFIESNKRDNEDNSTVRLSKELINKYYWVSPIIGCAYAYKGQDEAYPTNLNVDFGLADYNADATLALHLVEYGTIGIILFLWFYYSLIRYSVNIVFGKRKGYVVSVIIFLFFLAFSVTEGGLFYRPNYFYFYTYIFAVKRFKEENNLLSERYIIS